MVADPEGGGAGCGAQEEVEQLRDRNDDLMAELGDVKVQLDAATSESRKWAALYVALEVITPVLGLSTAFSWSLQNV